MAVEFFAITSVCKDDILAAFEGHEDFDAVKRKVESMSDDDMRYLAQQMADDYCEQLFWGSLKVVFEDRFMDACRAELSAATAGEHLPCCATGGARRSRGTLRR